MRYRPPADDGHRPRHVAFAGRPDGERFPFHGKLEIGRDDGARPAEPGLLLIPDPTVSRLHCVVTQRADGRCFVRDTSRNGTRLAGRRLVPQVDTEWSPGQSIQIGSHELSLVPDEAAAIAPSEVDSISTVPHADRCIVTVLVGDIQDYTVLVRSALSEALQRSVNRVFDRLSAAIGEHGGTVKEFQGDAILAFWEGDLRGAQAVSACRAALALDALTRSLGDDRSVWSVPDAPLHVDWALATGLVLIDSFGRSGPAGLSMMGEPVVRAFRMEKFATAETGRILACSQTRALTDSAFEFRDLGAMKAKGFDKPDRVFSLVGPR